MRNKATNQNSRNFTRRNKANENFVQLNEKISYEKLLVIDQNSSNIGLLTKSDALKLAEEKNLDLLVVSEHGEYPIARIVNYEKYRYEQQKKQKNNRKKQTNAKIKKVTFRPNIGTHDLEIKAKKARSWLVNGDSVKIFVRARGRLVDRNEIINDVYNKFIALIGIEVKTIKPFTKTTPIAFESVISEASSSAKNEKKYK